jgi:predicted murein hydrolase (TIGR00659 family)
MNEILLQSAYFGVGISLIAYWIGLAVKKRINWTICNPLLIAVLLVSGFLLIFDIDYETYDNGAKYITYFLTPSTVCLAVPLYRQLKILKKNLVAVATSIAAGSVSGVLVIFGLCRMLKIESELYYSMLPKSITTAIAIGVSEEIGGIPTVTVGAVVLTGLFGAIFATTICKIFKIQEPVAVGLAYGTSAHAIGTSKAMEVGEIEGAMSSLAIVVAGIIVVVLAPIMAEIG